MYRVVFAILTVFSVSVLAAQPLKLVHPACENRTNPLGVDTKQPRLSWKLISDERNVRQVAYQILVADNPANLAAGNGNIWNSGKQLSSASIQVKYNGTPLQPAKTYYWKVKVWDNTGNTAWSENALWQTGLFSASDWKNAAWIAYDSIPSSEIIVPALHGKPKGMSSLNNVLPLLRKNIKVQSALARATVFLTGLGQFEMSVNGQKSGDHFLDPGWTKYDKEALYVTFDITQQLKQGDNAIGVMLGNGFYFLPRDKRYRKLTGAYGFPKMICRIQLEYQNGAIENIVSDKSWKTAPGPVLYSSIYGGEDFDASLEPYGWNNPGFNDAGWKQPVITSGPAVLRSQMAEPLKIFEHFSPVKTTEIAKGIYVFDMGQNASAIPRIRVQGKKGDTVRVIPAELLAADGTANQKSTGKPVYYSYILKGDGVEEWQPRFTYYGLRYLQVEGAVPENLANSELPVLKEIKALHTRNAAPQVGHFSSSNDLFNRTGKLIDWAIRSNMVSIFTDCPHRERLGWQEEVHLMGPSIQYNYNIAGLCRKVMQDIKTAQTPDGLVPATVPEFTVMDFADGVFRDSPEWGSTSIILPWYMYEWYGDKETLTNNYEVMQCYLAYLGAKAKDYILSYGLSDWYDVGPQRSGFSQLTPMGITATAYYYYDLTIMEKAASLLGKTADARKYATLAVKVKQAFNNKFFDKANMQYGSGSQAANAIAVYMKLVEPQYKEKVVANIIKDIRNRNNSLTAGDIGYRYLLQVLANEGHSDVIYDMNSNPEVPGYGYQLAKGATALTESWVASPEVSNNHFMLGYLMEWLYGGLAGIQQSEESVAFKKIVIRPQVVGDITSAGANFESPYGKLSCKWKKTAKGLEMDVIIPANTTAELHIPIGKSGLVTENGKAVKPFSMANGSALLEVGSGNYHFRVTN